MGLGYSRCWDQTYHDSFSSAAAELFEFALALESDVEAATAEDAVVVSVSDVSLPPELQ
jgi:hypothetical protein